MAKRKKPSNEILARIKSMCDGAKIGAVIAADCVIMDLGQPVRARSVASAETALAKYAGAARVE